MAIRHSVSIPMTTSHHRIKGTRKLILALAIGLLCGVIAQAQDYKIVNLTPPTNVVDVIYYNGWAATNDWPLATQNVWAQNVVTADTNYWKWVASTSPGATNMDFSATNLPGNPCWLSFTMDAGTNQSERWTGLYFDTNYFLVGKQLKLFPPRGGKILRKP